jgi:hypothetical protein
MLSPEFIEKTAMLTLHATVKVSVRLERAVVKNIGTKYQHVCNVMGQKQLLCMCRSGMYSDRINWLRLVSVVSVKSCYGFFPNYICPEK